MSPVLIVVTRDGERIADADGPGGAARDDAAGWVRYVEAFLTTRTQALGVGGSDRERGAEPDRCLGPGFRPVTVGLK